MIYKLKPNSFILAIAFIACGATGLVAQDRTPAKGFQAGNAYSISDIEHVNLNNGNLILNLPLATVPGRGSAPAVTAYLNYNDKLWTARKEVQYDGTGGVNGSTTIYNRELLEPADDGGWYIGSFYDLRLINKQGAEDDAPCMAGNEAAVHENAYTYKVQMTTPEGSVIEFRPYGGEAYYSSLDNGFYRVNPSGWAQLYGFSESAGTPSCSYSQSQVSASGMTYYSTDGSNLRLQFPTNGTVEGNWTIYYPDGRKLENHPPDDSDAFQRMTDRNGNKINWRTARLNGVLGIKIENEVGHYVFIGNSVNDVNKVISLGVGGASLETDIHWRNYYVNRKYVATNDAAAPLSKRTEDTSWEFRFVDTVTLPQQAGSLQYLFTYRAAADSAPDVGTHTEGFGELATVTLPSGAVASYTHPFAPADVVTSHNTEVTSGGVSARDLTYHSEYDGSSTPVTEHTTYACGISGYSRVTGPDGGSATSVYNENSYFKGYAFRDMMADGSFEERIWSSNGNTNVTGTTVNAFVKTSFRTIPDASGNPSLTAITDYEYDKNGNVIEKTEYDWVPYGSVPRSGADLASFPTALPTAGLTVLRRTFNTYYNATPSASDTTSQNPNHYAYPNGPLLTHLIKSTEIRNAAGATAARSEFIYDSASTTGNLIETRNWDSTKAASLPSHGANADTSILDSSNSISTQASYNVHGQLIETVDANGNVTNITYGNVAGPNGNVTDLYPTQTVAAHGTSIARTSSNVYDFYTGAVTTATDVDNGLSTVTEYDALGRPTKVRSAANTVLESWTRTEYDDLNRRVVVRSDLDTIGDGRKVATQFYDQLGRVRLSKTLEDAATQSATNETDGIKVQMRYATATGYTYQLTSNPYRASVSTSETDTTMGWTRSKAWASGHESQVETFSGSSLPGPWGSSTSSTGVVDTVTDVNATTVTDQAGKLRRSITNSLGQLIRVDEPTGTANNGVGSLGSITSPNQATNYYYNALGKMVRVAQGDQNRYFMYDSLGRTTRIRQPEQDVNANLSTSGNPDNNSWTGKFTYDNNGNVLTTTDAKGTTVTSVYDALNRPTTRTYSDGTPTVTNYYDGAGFPSVPAHSKGKLTAVSSTVSETRYSGFDVMGRLLSSEQRTPFDDETTSTATPRASSYAYDLSGALIQETYPSGRVVQNELTPNGEIARIFGKVNSAALETTYATGFAYSPDGKIERLKLGNGLWESAKMNSRGQVTEFSLGHSVGDGSVWHDAYDYGELGTDGVTVDATKNAGNIAKQTISFSGLANPFVQTYKYDSLDRITDATENSGATTTWTQTFGFDRYGNRNSFYQRIGSQELAINSQTLPNVDPGKNRFTSGGFGYDANGNITSDPNDGGRTFIFNGDNKQVEVRRVSNDKIGRYSYDGNGKRVMKVTDLETTVFVYDGLGKQIAEYSTATPPDHPTTNYTATDQLGSPRVISNAFGEVVSRRDFMPFGEEIYSNENERKSADYYSTAGSDAVRNRFTGYQKDMETGLDFAEARYYDNERGRFTAIDPLITSGKSGNPQTFNRYVYARNRPIVLADSTGMQAGTSTGGWYAPNQAASDGYSHPIYVPSGREIPGGLISIGSRYYNSQSERWESPSLANAAGFMNTEVAAFARRTTLMANATMATIIDPLPVLGIDLRDPGIQMAAVEATGGLAAGAIAVDAGVGLASERMDAVLEGALEGAIYTETATTEMATVSTLEPGPFATQSIPARGPGPLNTAEQTQINAIGRTSGCHTCGNVYPGTKSGNFVGDHQPVSALIEPGEPQLLFPHCLRCSQSQGGTVTQILYGDY